MAMNPEIKAEWVAALRDPNMRQAHGVLIDYVDDLGGSGYGDPSYCCLGVLCEIATAHGVTKMVGGYYGPVADDFDTSDTTAWDEGVLPTCVAQWAGLDSQNPTVIVPDVRFDDDETVTLTDLNDGLELSFAKIADLIEAQL